MFHVIVNCGFNERFIERCITSIRGQTMRDWRAYVTADQKGDDTYRNALEAARGDARFDIVQNNRPLHPLENTLRAIARSGADDEDVFVVVDGDDWLLHDRAFAVIAATYERTGCWMTYGSWISNDPRMPGPLPAYDEGTTDFRHAPWRASHVRTWKKWLSDRIDDADLRDEKGRYFRRAVDAAYMWPMLEMSTTRRAKHIAEPLLLYNFGEQVLCRPAGEAARNAAYLRSRPPYRPLSAPRIPVRGTADSDRGARRRSY